MAESCHFRKKTLPSKWNCARFAALVQVSSGDFLRGGGFHLCSSISQRNRGAEE